MVAAFLIKYNFFNFIYVTVCINMAVKPSYRESVNVAIAL